MEASIPEHRRWIPVGMNVEYLHKATTNLTAICDLTDVQWNTTDEVKCNVKVFDTNQLMVVNAIIRMKVSDKPKIKTQ